MFHLTAPGVVQLDPMADRRPIYPPYHLDSFLSELTSSLCNTFHVDGGPCRVRTIYCLLCDIRALLAGSQRVYPGEVMDYEPLIGVGSPRNQISFS